MRFAVNLFGGEQWKTRTRNSQARSVLCSYGNLVETSLSSCGHTCTHLGVGSGRNGRTEKKIKSGVNSPFM